MIKFSKSLSHYLSDEFKTTLKNEIEHCDKQFLPLEKATSHGGYISDEAITASILGVTDLSNSIQINVGIFFTEIVICCGCGDEPMPINNYCEMSFDINKLSAETDVHIREI